MKNRYILGSLALLLAIFIAVIGIVPQLGIVVKEQQESAIEKVLDKSKVSTVAITIADADLQSMLANPLDEKMVSATVEINGETVKNVGIRTKGNMTLRSVAQMDDSDRYSFKIDFDKYVDEQNLHGLKKLNLNNNYSDPSQMREYLSYALMEKMGVPTPNYGYMDVTINGKEWGLYLGVEAIEEAYLQRNFADAKGDLYKPDGTGSDLQWISDDIADYSGINLKTNQGETDQSALLAMLDAINHGGDLEKYLNVDEMLRYFAVNTALVNLDSYQGDLKHNYYLYEENGVFSILPWDYNMAFAGYGVGGMGGGGGGRQPQAEGKAEATNAAGKQQSAAGVSEKTDEQAEPQNQNRGPGGGMGGGDMAANFMSDTNINFSITTPVSGTTLESRPLLNALLSVAQYREKYNAYLKEIASQYLTEEAIGSQTAAIAKLIAPYVAKDPTKFYTTEQFTASIAGEKSLPAFAAKRSASILAQLSGELVVAAVTSSDKGGPGGGEQGQAPPMGAGDDNQANAPSQQTSGGTNQGNVPSPQFGGGNNQPNAQPPQFGDGNNQPNARPPQFGGGNFGNMPSPGGAPGQSPAGSGYSMQTVWLSAGCLLGLIAALVFARFFKRRRA